MLRMFKFPRNPSFLVARRQFSRTSSQSNLRIGFVPEHFSTPLQFAQKHYGLGATLIPFPSGTGHMIQSLQSSEIDVGIGLTEAWVAGLAKGREKAGYKIVGEYVSSPLCWAISTGTKRDINEVSQLKGGKIGVSRIGSGSYVMPFVLADQRGWLNKSEESPFTFTPLSTFEKLRDGVNDGTVDAFMWEHFTSKRYYDNGEIKRIGEIYTPWASWKIVAVDPKDERLQRLFVKVNKGITHFRENQEEAISYISENLDYSAEDAREWMKTVEFVHDASEVGIKDIDKTIDLLQKAGVVESGVSSQEMIVAKTRP